MIERLRRPEEIANTRSETARKHRFLRLVGHTETEAAPAVWHEAFPGVEFRTLASGPEMMLTLIRIERGAAVPVHYHRAAQAGYVLDGCLRLTTPDEQRTVPAGDCYVVPPGITHQVRAIEPTTVIDAFAPGFVSAPEAGLFAVEAAGRPTELTRRPRRRPRRQDHLADDQRQVEGA